MRPMQVNFIACFIVMFTIASFHETVFASIPQENPEETTAITKPPTQKSSDSQKQLTWPVTSLYNLLPVSAPIVHKPLWGGFTEYYYAHDPETSYFLSVPPNIKKYRMVILIHGGCFINGSALDHEIFPLASHFRRYHYAVASLNYRSLTQTTWPIPLDDLAKGIHAIINSQQGKVIDITLIGVSSGATAAALLLYAPKYPGIPPIQHFIGLSGIYNPNSLAHHITSYIHETSLEHFTLSSALRFSGTPKSKTPALLIEGAQDYYSDRSPHSQASHAEFLAHYLRSNGVSSRVYWANTPGYTKHDGPVKLMSSHELTFMREIKHFLLKV